MKPLTAEKLKAALRICVRLGSLTLSTTGTGRPKGRVAPVEP
jgi:hypothetical protein